MVEAAGSFISFVLNLSCHFTHPFFKTNFVFLFQLISKTLTCLLIINAIIRDDEQPSSPQAYRRMLSREDAPPADVFSRLGAGIQDPVPGGLIREYNGKVTTIFQILNSLKCLQNTNFNFRFVILLRQN